MSDMVNMEMSEKEKEKSIPTSIEGKPEKAKGPQYPYGLKLDLDNESLDKMDIDLSEFDVGDNAMIMAKVKVSSKSIDKYDYDTKERKRISLQITHLCLEQGEEDEDEGEMDWEDDEKEPGKVDQILRKKGY